MFGHHGQQGLAVAPQDIGPPMLLIFALLLFLIFGGLGFVLHLLWLGLIVAVVLGIAHFLLGDRRRV